MEQKIPDPKKRRPITHTYIVKSTDPLVGFVSKTGTPMILPRRFSRGWKGRGKTLSLVNRDDVRVFMEEIDNG